MACQNGFVLVMAVNIAVLGACGAMGSEVTEVVESAMALPALIHAYEFSVIETDIGVNRRISAPLVKKVNFYQSGDMFRAEVSPEREIKGGLGKVIVAYNGARFQQFYENESVLSFSRKSRFPNPYFALNPLIMPYMWLWSRPPFVWSDLKSDRFWADSTKNARFVGRQTVRSMECDVISLPYPAKPSVSVTVYMAIELGHYPIRFEGSGLGAQRFELDVLEHSIIESDGSDVIIPVVERLKERRATGKEQTLEWKILPESVKINHELPEEFFTLSPSMAKRTDDYDRNMERLLKSGVVRATAPPTPTRHINWLLSANFFVVLILMMVYAARRYLRRARFDE
jgi:hypothetical protein